MSALKSRFFDFHVHCSFRICCKQTNQKKVPSAQSGSGRCLSDAAAGHTADPVSHHVSFRPVSPDRPPSIFARPRLACRRSHRATASPSADTPPQTWATGAAQAETPATPYIAYNTLSGNFSRVCHSQCRARSIDINTDSIDTKVSISTGPIL